MFLLFSLSGPGLLSSNIHRSHKSRQEEAHRRPTFTCGKAFLLLCSCYWLSVRLDYCRPAPKNNQNCASCQHIVALPSPADKAPCFHVLLIGFWLLWFGFWDGEFVLFRDVLGFFEKNSLELCWKVRATILGRVVSLGFLSRSPAGVHTRCCWIARIVSGCIEFL